jgi:hypothetical protein
MVVSTVPGTTAGIQLLKEKDGFDMAAPSSFTFETGLHFQSEFNSYLLWANVLLLRKEDARRKKVKRYFIRIFYYNNNYYNKYILSKTDKKGIILV